MKIRKVIPDNRKKCFTVVTSKGMLEFPYSRLEPGPTVEDKVRKIAVERELSSQAFTYQLESGKENTVPLDQVLEYNEDPDYLREILLYKLTLKAQSLLKEKGLAKREVIRRMKTSPTQFYRLIDQANYHKTIDQMTRLLTVLDCPVDIVFKKAA